MTSPLLEPLAVVHNGRVIDRGAVPRMTREAFGDALLEAVAQGHRVVSMFANLEGAEGGGGGEAGGVRSAGGRSGGVAARGLYAAGRAEMEGLYAGVSAGTLV